MATLKSGSPYPQLEGPHQSVGKLCPARPARAWRANVLSERERDHNHQRDAIYSPLCLTVVDVTSVVQCSKEVGEGVKSWRGGQGFIRSPTLVGDPCRILPPPTVAVLWDMALMRFLWNQPVTVPDTLRKGVGGMDKGGGGAKNHPLARTFRDCCRPRPRLSWRCGHKAR